MKELKVNNEIDGQLQEVKTDEESSSLEISKSKVKTQNLQVDGDLTVNGNIKGALKSTDNINIETEGSSADINLKSDGGITITAVDNVELDLAKSLILDVGTSREIFIKENGGTYTPTDDNHVATKKYVDDNAGGGSGDIKLVEDISVAVSAIAESMKSGLTLKEKAQKKERKAHNKTKTTESCTFLCSFRRKHNHRSR